MAWSSGAGPAVFREHDRRAAPSDRYPINDWVSYLLVARRGLAAHCLIPPTAAGKALRLLEAARIVAPLMTARRTGWLCSTSVSVSCVETQR